MQSLVTSRYVLQAFLDELLEFDRDIAVARHVQVGDVADALHHLLRATAPGSRVDERLGRLTAAPEGKPRPSRRRRRPVAGPKALRSRGHA